MFLSSKHQTKLGPGKSKQSLNFAIGPHQVFLRSHSRHALIRKLLPKVHYFLVFEHVVIPITPSEVTKDVQQKICINARIVAHLHDILEVIRAFPSTTI